MEVKVWKIRKPSSNRLGANWIVFFNDAWFYASKEDIILTVMSGLTLPGAVAISVWERKVTDHSRCEGSKMVRELYLWLVCHIF